jgi:hypothetical protein
MSLRRLAPSAESAPAGVETPAEPTRSSALASSLAGRCLLARSSASISTSRATARLASLAAADQENAFSSAMKGNSTRSCLALRCARSWASTAASSEESSSFRVPALITIVGFSPGRQ